MAKVEVEVESITMVNDDGYDQEGVRVSCTRCSSYADVFGTSEKSIKRGCVMLSEKCAESNFYVSD